MNEWKHTLSDLCLLNVDGCSVVLYFSYLFALVRYIFGVFQLKGNDWKWNRKQIHLKLRADLPLTNPFVLSVWSLPVCLVCFFYSFQRGKRIFHMTFVKYHFEHMRKIRATNERKKLPTTKRFFLLLWLWIGLATETYPHTQCYWTLKKRL